MKTPRQNDATYKPAVPVEGAVKLKPRRRRRATARPLGGWGLIAESAQRLGLWQALSVHAAQRAFAVACHKLVPRLEPQARAEALEGEGRVLVVRCSSSAVASELVYVKDLLVEQVNAQLALLSGGAIATKSSRSKSAPQPAPRVERLQYRVGPVKSLPDYAVWRIERPRRVIRERPRSQPDLQVAKALNSVSDETTRDALAALYAAATQVSKAPRK